MTLSCMFTGTCQITCVPCSSGQYRSSHKDMMCWQCPEGSWSAEGSIECNCHKGWAQQGEKSCTKCPPNTFNSARGSAKCQPCPLGMVSPEASDDPMSCVPCPAGQYRSSLDVMRRRCPDGSWSEEGSTKCSCNKGWTQQGKTCTKCSHYTFKAVRGASKCQQCPLGMVSPEASEDLMQCAPEDWLGTLSSGLSLMLKSAGVLEEDSHERRWRLQYAETRLLELHQYTETGLMRFSAFLQQAPHDFVAVSHDTVSWIITSLHDVILDLFVNPFDFYNYFVKAAASSYSSHICSR